MGASLSLCKCCSQSSITLSFHSMYAFCCTEVIFFFFLPLPLPLLCTCSGVLDKDMLRASTPDSGHTLASLAHNFAVSCMASLTFCDWSALASNKSSGSNVSSLGVCSSAREESLAADILSKMACTRCKGNSLFGSSCVRSILPESSSAWSTCLAFPQLAAKNCTIKRLL